MPTLPDMESGNYTHTLHGTSTYEVVQGYPVTWEMTLTVDTPEDPGMLAVLQAFANDLASLPTLTVQSAYRSRGLTTPVAPDPPAAP